ncbi:UBX domain-containing protein 10 isoform X2 [Tachysurus fulvidraco]|uniref:UBX domain-containing protein 10 isoform X2 n=1 Tax=Tachysurus fulvidraco TaxID=1234273 RepID=UPI001FEDB525|nr:UBX domain-containing protein 10 isoform X2 [Tachysurus fulvidraco]
MAARNSHFLIILWFSFLTLIGQQQQTRSCDQETHYTGNMHVIRPKSAKGRTRPKVTEACTADDELLQEVRPFSSHPPSHPPHPPPTPSHRFDSSPSPRPLVRQNNLGSAGETVLNIPLMSLNKYKVLPSIEKRSEEEAPTSHMEEKSLRSRLHTNNLRSDQEIERASSGTVRMSTWCQEGETGDLGVLLALRTPCGQRLKCQFQPTDTLQDVVATAERISGKTYKHVLIETMEVPRRSFTNLNMTLSQCSIVTKSVLCISLKDDP